MMKRISKSELLLAIGIQRGIIRKENITKRGKTAIKKLYKKNIFPKYFQRKIEKVI